MYLCTHLHKTYEGARVTFDIALPAAVSLLIARAVGRLVVGSTREQKVKTEIRQAYLRERFAKYGRGSGGSNSNMDGRFGNSMRASESEDSFYGNSTNDLTSSMTSRSPRSAGSSNNNNNPKSTSSSDKKLKVGDKRKI
jgi:hypothetical protein